jgi:arylsulfatase A-like enzyme
MLGDHFMIQKGVPWKQALNVPLAMHVPNMRPIGRNDFPVEFTDITATILDFAGLIPAQALSRSWPAYNNILPGRSLFPILRGEVESIREYAFSESDFTEERGLDTIYSDVIDARGARRTNSWQAITTKTTKYIKYLEYETPGDIYEEFYDLSKDSNETINLIKNPEYSDLIQQARFRLMYIIDHYPPCQKTWAGRFLLNSKKR